VSFDRSEVELSYAVYHDDKIVNFYSIVSGMTAGLQPGCHAVYDRA
jgi:hypothetical protein